MGGAQSVDYNVSLILFAPLPYFNVRNKIKVNPQDNELNSYVLVYYVCFFIYKLLFVQQVVKSINHSISFRGSSHGYALGDGISLVGKKEGVRFLVGQLSSYCIPFIYSSNYD